MQNTENYLKSYNLKLGNVNIVPSTSTNLKYGMVIQNKEPNKNMELLEYLYVKDAMNQSDYMYEIQRQRNQHWPPFSQIRNFRKDINAQLENQVFSNTKGYFTSVKNMIVRQINEFHAKNDKKQNLK